MKKDKTYQELWRTISKDPQQFIKLFNELPNEDKQSFMFDVVKYTNHRNK
jgi:hypothetical protein